MSLDVTEGRGAKRAVEAVATDGIFNLRIVRAGPTDKPANGDGDGGNE